MITLAELSSLAHTLLAERREHAEISAKLAQVADRIQMLEEESIPTAMQELGITKFTLDSGEQISIKEDVYASIPVARREEAYSWLEQHNFGGLIKTEIALHFTRGELEQAQQLMQQLQQQGLKPELERGVHVQTLRAFLREQLAAAAVMPLDLFGATQKWATKVVMPK